MTEYCFDCKYSSVVNNMQSCAWHTGLASAYAKCEKYERKWSATLLPYVFIIGFLLLIIRVIILGIWRV